MQPAAGESVPLKENGGITSITNFRTLLSTFYEHSKDEILMSTDKSVAIYTTNTIIIISPHYITLILHDKLKFPAVMKI